MSLLPLNENARPAGEEQQLDAERSDIVFRSADFGTFAADRIVLVYSFTEDGLPPNARPPEQLVGQVVSFAGDALGSEFVVNDYTTASASYPSVWASSGRGFVVTWQNRPHLYPRPYAHARVFGPDGTPSAPAFEVDSYTTGIPTRAQAMVRADGDVLVVWDVRHLDGDGGGVFGRVFAPDGTPRFDRFQVNSHTTGQQVAPRLAALPGDDFVVAWSDYLYFDGDTEVRARVFDSMGSPKSPEFRVNSYTTGQQVGAKVGSASDGRFVVTWQSSYSIQWDPFSEPDSRGQDGSGFGVYGQMFSADGTRIGTEFQVNSYTTGEQYGVSPATADRWGNFVVSYRSFDYATRQYQLLARRYITDPTCGDTDGNRETDTTDAHRALRAAVGTSECTVCLCDTDGNLTANATDALLILQTAVGMTPTLACPPCS